MWTSPRLHRPSVILSVTGFQRVLHVIILLFAENTPSSSIELTDTTSAPSIAVTSLSCGSEREASTPLSFHSVASSANDDPCIVSAEDSVSKAHLFTDAVNELLKSAKDLDKLSYSLSTFTSSIHDFVRSSIDQKTHAMKILERDTEKYVTV